MKKMFINGEWVESQTQGISEIINPYNREIIATVTVGDRKDTIKAIQAARKAFDEGEWRRTTATERGGILFQIAQLVKENREELATLETLNTGKTYTESLDDIDGVASVFQYYAGLADKESGMMIDSPNPDTVSRVVREPVGVCGLIAPWNYPLLQASYKLAPALAAGNTMVIKPSEITPLTMIKLAELFEKVGLPAGVVNVVLGPGSKVGQELAENSDVDLISFTGGTTAGQKVMQAASVNFKKISLELGGKNPNIVFADADFNTAVDYALNAVFFNAGQVCSAGTRLLVEEKIHDQFIDAVVNKAKNIRLGNGFHEETQMGPVVSAEQLQSIEKYIQIGVEEGAKLVLGGNRPNDPELQNGFFIEPTIFINCNTKMRIVQEETFGPILTVETFTSEEEAIQLGNDTIYGLAGAVWTQDMNRAERVAQKLRAGTVWINDYHPSFPQAPWGGYKQSGIGREMGLVGFEEFTELKHVYMNTNTQPMGWFK